MSGGIDWGAIANAAGAAQSLGGMYPGADLSKNPYLNNNDVNNTPAQVAAENNVRYHSGAQPGGALYQQGLSLLGPLHMPSIQPTETFSWEVKNINGRQTLTQMTLAGALSWFRNLATTNVKGYDEIVAGLVRAGYLSPSEARYGGYTNTVATKFLQSAIDVEQINNDKGHGGIVTTWFNHIDALANGRMDSGQINPDGSSGSSSSGGSAGPKAPTRTDQYMNPEDVKAAINSAAHSVLGRRLTPEEEAQFTSAYHGQEATWNNQNWAQQQASFEGAAAAPAAVSHPSLTDSATNYVDTSPALAGDRTKQLLGSYIGVLRNMTGLGAGGVAHAVG